jgi:polysaccharide export outer membrane protein
MFRCRYLVRAAAVAAVAMAGGCAFAPGMQADAGMPPVVTITARIDELQQHAADAGPAEQVLALTAAPASTGYAIGPGDVLAISVLHHPELASPAMRGDAVAAKAEGFVVDGQGRLSFPYADSLPVAGKTVEQARDALAAALSRFFHAPRVNLRVLEYRSRKIYVAGAVRSPGKQAITDVPMTLAQALSDAGGLSPSGDSSWIWLYRDGQAYRLDLPALGRHGIGSERIHLRDQDRIRIDERMDHPVFVAGEVGAPRPLPLHGGSLSLGEALAEAGSISQVSADSRNVYVVRLENAASTPTVYRLDARTPVGLALAARFPLRPNDLVYVQPSGLVRWNRVMNLLLSSSMVLYNSRRAGDDR